MEISTKGAKYTAKYAVSAPVAKAEEKKKKLYEPVCYETLHLCRLSRQRNVEFGPSAGEKTSIDRGWRISCLQAKSTSTSGLRERDYEKRCKGNA